MILTVCMSPSVDITLEVDPLLVGKMNVVQKKMRTYTGKAINVAIGVRRLGHDAVITGFLYKDNGAHFERELLGEGVRCEFIWNEGCVRENYKVIDLSRCMLTEINDVGEAVKTEKLVHLVDKVRTLSKEADVTIVSGGLPRGVDVSFYREIMKAVDKKSLRIADTEGGRLFAALEAGVDLIKPNREELERSLHRELKTREDLIEACEELQHRGAKAVLLSLGRDGAVLASGKERYYCKSDNIEVASSVGAGDGMVAAAAVKMQEGASLPEVLRAGVAAGTAAVTTQKVSFTKEKYDELISRLTVTKF